MVRISRAAVTALCTLVTTNTSYVYHVRALASMAFTKRCMTRTDSSFNINPNASITKKYENNLNIHKNMNDNMNMNNRKQVQHLFSSLSVDNELLELDNESVSVSSSKESVTAAIGDALTFIPSPDGVSGLMAIKLRELEPDPILIPTDMPTPIPSTSTTSTGMFGGINKATNSQRKAIESQDMTGKTVTFQNGSTATIIAQRPPIAFAACNFNSWDSTNNISTINAKNNISDSTTTKSTNNNINKLLDQIRIPLISVLDTSTAISVSNDIIGQIVDCYLQPISHYQHLSNTPNQSNPDTNTNIHTKRNIFAPIPQVKDISLINSPLLTGLAMVDALAPIGKGQNMLIIGKDTGIGQRDILISTIQTQLNRNNSKKLKCIYALTSHDPSVKEMVLQKLKDANVLDQIVVVTTRSSNTNNHNDTAATNASSTSQNMDNNAVLAAEAILVSSTACSIGEAFALSQGEDSLVIIDDIDQHKSFWDWTTRVLVDIWGVDSVVKSDREGGASSEMRAFYSNLIQRAARFNKKNGDGSVTLSLITNLPGALGGSGGDSEDDVVFSPSDFELSAEKVKQRISILVDKKIPLTPANLRKIQIPVPKSSESERKRRLALQHVDDLISMSDGQIWLDENLYEKGQRPALDPQRSITRVGIGADTDSRADAPAISALAGGLRFEFAQAASLDGAGVNSGADKQILKRDALLLAMHQESEVGGRLLSENCVALLAALKGYLNGVIQKGGLAGTETGKQEVDGLLSYVWQSAPDVMKSIDESLDLTSDTRSELESILKDYFANK